MVWMCICNKDFDKVRPTGVMIHLVARSMKNPMNQLEFLKSVQPIPTNISQPQLNLFSSCYNSTNRMDYEPGQGDLPLPSDLARYGGYSYYQKQGETTTKTHTPADLFRILNLSKTDSNTVTREYDSSIDDPDNTTLQNWEIDK